METSSKKIQNFQRKVFTFYQNHKRNLPWRRTNNPYKILVSELMLQQTQVSRVITFYHTWMKQWPTVDRLASASRRDVLQAWMGLGYNSRAIRLHKAAHVIMKEFKGDVLQAMHHNKAIPGVGRYTSQAVLIFATNADLVTVDTNIRRIFIHEFGLPETVSERILWDLARRCLPKGRSRDWHNALMDYGALHLTAQKTGVRPATRQSRFEGSDRQMRASIVRILLKGSATFSELLAMTKAEQPRLERILQKMVDEQLIVVKGPLYKLSG
jgi:A/G-specific adenine glycosylase